MANKDLISLFIERYLRRPSYSVRDTEFFGLINDTKPKLKPFTPGMVLSRLPENPIATSFIRVARAIGITAIDSSSNYSILWAQLTTMLLSQLDPTDQDATVKKYAKIHSLIVSPTNISPGLFYTYKYKAESVEDYDKFPMTLVLSRDGDSMLGMNMHYLPLKYRFSLFEAMMPLIVPIPVDQLSRINMTYQRLKGTSGFAGKPTIKRYLFSRFKSNAVFVSPIEWAVAMAYPSQEFVGNTKRTVWKKTGAIWRKSVNN